MAGTSAHCSLCRNFFPIGKNELTGAAPTEGSGSPIPRFIMLCAPTPVPATALAATPFSDNKLFK